MRSLIITLLVVSCWSISGCTYLRPYQPPLQQGNIITQDMLQQIKVGMTKGQVAEKLGPPVLKDPFDNNYWTYIYTYQPSRGRTQEKSLIIYFQNNQVARFTTDIPAPIKLPLPRKTASG